MWKIVVKLRSGAVEPYNASVAPGFYPEGVMTFFSTTDTKWVTYAIGVIERVDYWSIPGA